MSSSTSFRSWPAPQEKKTPKHTFRVCLCFRRMFKPKAVELPKEVKEVFEMYSSDDGTMSVEELHRFLRDFQKEKDAKEDDAQAIVDSFRHLNIFHHHRRGFHIDAFLRYLFSDRNSPIVSSPGVVHDDMTAPLAHYFLYTGHNSYLTGNQFSSPSSTKPIIEALTKGVRVIELDLWPNSKGDEAEVRHGGTLTSPVKLIDCLEAIKKYAFQASNYPVVITFEDHLPSRLQAKVGKMVKEVFEEMLYIPESPHQKQFPSPESLKNKVMISTKPPEDPETRGDVSNIDKNGDESEEKESVKGYRDLIAIHAGKPKGDKEKWLTHHPDALARRLSLSEQQLEAIAKTHATNIVRFTPNNLLRIYPKGTRVDSSNYDPMIGWTHGAQMVAFNIQKRDDDFLRIMEGMFRRNGGCGYVKKPDILLKSNNDVFDPSSTERLPVKQTLQVTVCMGEGWHSDFGGTHFDCYSPPDFFVKVSICGVAADAGAMRRTKTIKNHWIPTWNEEFEFELRVLELALLRIEALEEDTSKPKGPDFAGQTCLPVAELKAGIRAVPLHDRKGQPYKHARLLMAFRFNHHHQHTSTTTHHSYPPY